MKEQMLKLRDEGHTYAKIAEILGCNKSTVCYHCTGSQKYSRASQSRKRRENMTTLERKIEQAIYNGSDRIRARDSKNNIESSMLNRASKLDAKQKFINNNICYLTGKVIDLDDSSSYSIDHVIPLSKGGDNRLENLALATTEANQSKTYLLLEEYIQLCKDVLTMRGYTITKD